MNTLPLNLKKHYAGCRRNTHFVEKGLRRSPYGISKKSMPSRTKIFADVPHFFMRKHVRDGVPMGVGLSVSSTINRTCRVNDFLTAEFPSVRILDTSTQLLCTKPRNHLKPYPIIMRELCGICLCYLAFLSVLGLLK